MSSAQFADQLVHFSAEHLVQSRKCPAAPKDARVRRRNSSFPTYTRHSRPAVTRSKLVSKFGQSAHDRQSRLRQVAHGHLCRLSAPREPVQRAMRGLDQLRHVVTSAERNSTLSEDNTRNGLA